MNAAQTAFEANATSSDIYLRRATDYYQAKEMMWKMWVDYQTEYALLEALVGENL